MFLSGSNCDLLGVVNHSFPQLALLWRKDAKMNVSQIFWRIQCVDKTVAQHKLKCCASLGGEGGGTHTGFCFPSLLEC